MRTPKREILTLGVVAGLVMGGLVACSDDDDDGGRDAGRDVGVNVDLGGGDLGTDTATGDAGAADGATTDGAATDGAATDGAATDGATADSGGGDAGGSTFWSGAYSASCKPDDSAHRKGQACLTCHSSTGGAPAFVLGGTVYAGATGDDGAPAVEVGVKSGDQLLTTCTDDNGNFYLASGTVAWAQAQVKLRDASGESNIKHPSELAANGNCNSCHTGGARLVAP